jgi:hypothetical protein
MGQLNQPLQPPRGETAGPVSQSGLPSAPVQAATRQQTYQPGAFTSDRLATGSSGLPGTPSTAGSPAGGRPSGLHGIAGQPSNNPSGLTDAGQNPPDQPTAGQPSLGQSVAGQPSLGQSVAGQPSLGQPIAGQPSPGQSVASQPPPWPAVQPAAVRPAASQPEASQPSAGRAPSWPAESASGEGGPSGLPPRPDPENPVERGRDDQNAG